MVPVNGVFIEVSCLLYLTQWLQRYCGIMCVNGFLSFTNIDRVMRRNVVYYNVVYYNVVYYNVVYYSVVYYNVTEYSGEFDLFYSPKRGLHVFSHKRQYFCSCLEHKKNPESVFRINSFIWYLKHFHVHDLIFLDSDVCMYVFSVYCSGGHMIILFILVLNNVTIVSLKKPR
jgi:hypothetical protein